MLIFRLPDPCNQQLWIGVLDAQQRRNLPLKGFRIGDVICDLDIQFLTLLHGDEVNLLFIQDADVNFIPTAEQLDRNDVFQNTPVIHIFCSQSGEAKALVRQVIFVFRAKISLAADIISPNPIERKGLAQSIHIFSDCLVIDLCFVGGQRVRDGANLGDVADVIHQKVDQLMQQRLVSQPVLLYNIADDQCVEHFAVDIAIFLRLVFIEIGTGHAAFGDILRQAAVKIL